MTHSVSNKGFTLIELIIVIVILGVLAVVAAPKFLNFSKDAKAAAINSMAGQMRSTINLARAKAQVSGLRTVGSNPGTGQSAYVVDFGFGSSEVDFRNLCPESSAELGDNLDFVDFLNLSLSDDMSSRQGNRYTIVGYTPLPTNNLTSSTIAPLPSGCYVIYDSFGDPDCTIVVVEDDC